MPTGEVFSFQVLVGNKPVEELTGLDKRTYIESDLNVEGVSFKKEEVTEARHGEVEKQSWPVTPYMVVVDVHGPPSPSRWDTWYWFDMYVDGSRVWNKPLRQGRKMTVEGTMDRKAGAFRELLFSLPRFQHHQSDRLEAGRAAEVGTITVVCTEAIFAGYRQKTFYQRDNSRRGHGLAQRSDFIQATKSDCSSGGLLTTATGRELYRFTQTASGVGQETVFRRGRVLEERTLHYRMRHALIEMGLVQEPTTLCSNVLQPVTIPRLSALENLDRDFENLSVSPQTDTSSEILKNKELSPNEKDSNKSKNELLPHQKDSEKSNDELELSPQEKDSKKRGKSKNDIKSESRKKSDSESTDCKIRTRSMVKKETDKTKDKENQPISVVAKKEKFAETRVEKLAETRVEKVSEPRVKTEKDSFDPGRLQPIRTRVVEEVIVRQNELGEDVKVTRRVESLPLERYVRVDDDLFIVESLDDSVVLIGDDDCYVVEPPVQEFPFVELE